jgi:hypothetical protein
MKSWCRGVSRKLIRVFLATIISVLFVATQSPASVTNVASGNLTHEQTIFAAVGGGSPLGLGLLYESLSSSSGSLGTGWIHSADIFLTVDTSGNVLLREESSRIYYRKSGSSYLSQPGDSSTLTGENGSFIITRRDGTRYTFNSANRIAAISDRFGNSLTFGYTGSDLTTICKIRSKLDTIPI